MSLQNMPMYKNIPWVLVSLRFLLTVPAVLFGYLGFTGLPYIVLLLAAAATDYWDGKLARRQGAETALLRQADSIADTIFFLGVLGGMWFAYPAIYQQYAWGIYTIIALEVVRYGYDLTKFGRGASYHSLSAKVFGVSLLIATLFIMGFGISWLLYPAIALGIVSEFEGLVISILLHEWCYNVRHIGIAIKLRQQQ